MKTLQFNTDIKCDGCKARVSPFLNSNEKIKQWKVDTSRSDKLLTVETDLDSEEIIKVVEKAGFKAKAI